MILIGYIGCEDIVYLAKRVWLLLMSVGFGVLCVVLTAQLCAQLRAAQLRESYLTQCRAAMRSAAVPSAAASTQLPTAQIQAE